MNIYLILAVLIWGLNNTLCKVALEYIDPISFNMWRFLISLPIIWTITIIYRKGNIFIKKEEIFRTFYQALIGVPLYQFLFILSLFYTTSTNAILIIFGFSPIVTVIILTLFFKHIVIRNDVIGIFLSLVGVSFVILNRTNYGINYFITIGNFIAVLAAIVWGAYPIFNKKWIDKYSPLLITTYSFTLSAFIFSILTIFLNISFWPIPLKLLLIIIYTGLIGGVFGHILFFKGISIIGSKKSIFYMYLIPVSTSLFSYLILKEKITILQIFGAISILIGFLFIQNKDFKLNKLVFKLPFK